METTVFLGTERGEKWAERNVVGVWGVKSGVGPVSDGCR